MARQREGRLHGGAGSAQLERGGAEDIDLSPWLVAFGASIPIEAPLERRQALQEWRQAALAVWARAERLGAPGDQFNRRARACPVAAICTFLSSPASSRNSSAKASMSSAARSSASLSRRPLSILRA